MYTGFEDVLQTLYKVGTLFDPEFCGQMPIRTEIEILPGDPVEDLRCPLRVSSRGKMSKYNGKLKLGWTIHETIGIAVVNTRGISKLTKTSVVK